MRTLQRIIIIGILWVASIPFVYAQIDRPFFGDNSHLIMVPKKTVVYPVGPLNTQFFESWRTNEKWNIPTLGPYSKDSKKKIKTNAEVPVIGFAKSSIELPRYDYYIVIYDGALCYLASDGLPDNALIDSFNYGIYNRYEQLKQEIIDKRDEFLYRVLTKAVAASKRREYLEANRKVLKDSIINTEIARRQKEIDDKYYGWESANPTRKKTANYIILHQALLEAPNSASGCDYFMSFTNTSKKPIKYLDWTGVTYNAVNDRVMCTIRNTSTFSGRVTGPITPGEFHCGSWEAIIYNWSAKTMKLTKLVITFMDGGKKVLSSDEISSVMYAPDRYLSESSVSYIKNNFGKEIDKEIKEMKDIEVYQTRTSFAKYSNSRLLKEDREIYLEVEELTKELNSYRERNCLPKWSDAPESVKSLVTLQ